MSTIPFDAQNAGYVQALYELYAQNPNAVPQPWRRFFAQGPATTVRAGLLVPDGLTGNGAQSGNGQAATLLPARTAVAAPASIAADAWAVDTARGRFLSAVARGTALVQALRDHGYMLAQIDPLGSEPPGHPQLDPAFFGTSMEELEQIPSTVGP